MSRRTPKQKTAAELAQIAEAKKAAHRERMAHARAVLASVKAAKRAAAAVPTPEQTEHAELVAAAGGRPRTRGECPTFRPCPWVSCRYHLAIDIQKRRVVHLSIDPDDWTEATPTCALDLADEAPTVDRRGRGSYSLHARGGMTLDEVGAAMGVTRERVRQVEEKALAKLAAAGLDLREGLDTGRRAGITRPPPEPEITPTEAHAGYLRMRASFIPPAIRTLDADEVAAAVAELRAHPKAPRGIA